MNALRSSKSRFGFAALALLSVLFTVGHKTAQAAPPFPWLGIDPFEVLDLQVKPNVIFILDTSGSMAENTTFTNLQMTGDDPGDKMYQAKAAINAVIVANQGKFNFGLASYAAPNTAKTLTDAPLTYMTSTSEPGALIWTGDNAGTTSYFASGTNLSSPNLVNNFTTNSEDGEVYRSFRRGNQAYPGPGCGPGVDCRLPLFTSLYRTNLKFKWTTTATANPGAPGSIGSSNILTSITSINCANFPPPAGFFPDDPPGMVRPCIQMENSSASPLTTTFWFAGGRWQSSTSNCGGAAILDNVAACSVDNVPSIQQKLQLEIPLWDMTNPGLNSNACGGPRGTPCGLTAAPISSTSAPDLTGQNPGVLAGVGASALGVSSASNTPLGGSLDDIFSQFATVFPLPGGGANSLQKHFAVLLTDGAETCNTNAVQAASNLWNRNGNAAGQFAETFVVGFSLTAADQASLNAISCAGSGGAVSSCGTTTCTCAGGTRPTALAGSNTQELIDALSSALAQITSAGVFSATPSVLASIPEYVGAGGVPQPASPAAPFDALNPLTRYRASAPRAYRASFDTAGFVGVFEAFDSNGAVPGWEAGQKLMNRLDPVLRTAPCAPNAACASDRTFDQILGGDMIKRRIFTTSRNGVNPSVALLWSTLSGTPSLAGPDPGVLGTATAAGSLDQALFRRSDGTQMMQGDLEAPPIGACKGGGVLPAACTSGTASVKLARTQYEARQIVLGYTAGVKAVRDVNGFPVRNGSGEILFRGRTSLLTESTLASPAVVTQPLQEVPGVHPAEYLLMRDGPRLPGGQAVDEVDQGFGLRNPDADRRECPVSDPTPCTGVVRPNLKPVMSTVFLPTNGGLHAFRAGPQQGGVNPPPFVGESGGEELWLFIPFDQLAKLKDRLKPQTRTDHVFMMASSVRVDFVFKSGTVVVNGATYPGAWRQVLVVGRGLGGKYYSALDITAPGPFTRDSLLTNLPTVWWNRGNPDTTDGQPFSGSNYAGSAADYTAYQGMGTTWSTMAVARVPPDPPVPAYNGAEYVGFVGSGYSDQPSEGTTFYGLDMATGAVLTSSDVGDLSPSSVPSYENAIVANPSIYSAEQLVAGFDLPNPAGSVVTAVYFGDLHGRLWKIDTANPTTPVLVYSAGVDHPFSVAPSLLNVGGIPHIYFASGYDARATTGAPFKMYGVEDPDGGPPALLPNFPVDFPDDPSKGVWRGTIQPITAFRDNVSQAVAFFIGTRYNPAVSQCISSFDSIVFAFDGDDGNVLIYPTLTYIGEKAIGAQEVPIEGPGGEPPFDGGVAAPGMPLNPPFKIDQDKPKAGAVVKVGTVYPGSSVCR